MMNKQDARAYILNKGLSRKDIATPYWQELDGLLAVRKLSGREGLDFQKLETDAAAAQLVISSLIFKETGEQVFGDFDRDTLLQAVELDILTQIAGVITEFNGIQPKAVEDAKKNLNGTTNDASSSDLHEAVVVP